MKNIIKIDEKTINNLSSFATFRNILIHKYQETTPNVTFVKVEELIDILPEYLKELKKVI